MADIDVSTLLKPNYLRRTHLNDAITLFDGSDQDSYTALDQAADKTALTAAINTLIDAVKAQWETFASEADFDAAMDQLKLDQAAAIASGIQSTVTCNKSDVFTEALDDLDTAMGAYAIDDVLVYPYTDGRCNGEGRYPAGRDPEENPTNTTPKHCASCDGIGKVQTANRPNTSWSETTTFNL